MISPPEQPGPLPLDRVAAWMARQRWYANKGATPPLEELGRVVLETTEPGVAVVIHLLLDRTTGSSALYQVPLSYRRDGRLAGTPDARRARRLGGLDSPGCPRRPGLHRESHEHCCAPPAKAAATG
jgi:hypothetical protein